MAKRETQAAGSLELQLSVAPNPSSPFPSIAFEIPAPVGDGTDVDISLYDVIGRRVQVILHRYLQPGTYQLNWQTVAARGHLEPGVYFVRLVAGSNVRTKKVIIAP